MAEAFSRFADGPTKTAAAMALLGKTGADMIPILDKGKEGLDEFREVARRSGVEMAGETIEAFSHTQEADQRSFLSPGPRFRRISSAFSTMRPPARSRY